jgi:phosphoesterase RecJ-like protein
MPTAVHTDSIAEILSVIGAHQTFVVTSHARPDGDAIGSALGMMHLLDAMGKDVTVAFADVIPEIYRGIPGVERIVHALPSQRPDAAVLLECDSVVRTGFDQIEAGTTINIDHHLSGKNFADHNWIDASAAAVGALVYELAIAAGQRITPEMATCLYTAVVTDTGSFQFSSTTPATFALASHLVDSGADHNGVAQAVFFSNPAAKMRLLGVALNRMVIDDSIAWSFITQSDMAATGAGVEDCEGVVNSLIGIEGVCAAVFLREMPGGKEFRLSLRSKDPVNVAEVAGHFAGGGHRNASGGTVDGPVEEAVNRVVGALQVACRSKK